MSLGVADSSQAPIAAPYASTPPTRKVPNRLPVNSRYKLRGLLLAGSGHTQVCPPELGVFVEPAAGSGDALAC